MEEVKEILTTDYIYLPFTNKEELKLNEDGKIYKNENITKYNGQNIKSPVSGSCYGISELGGTVGILNVLIIENDFKDKTKKRLVAVRDIYKTKTEDLKKILKDTNEELILNIECIKREEYILKDNINEILETLNLINLKLNIKTTVNLDKKDLNSYKLLFSYLGTYPNIEITFNKPNNSISLYKIIDIYNKIKNKIDRDFIYINIKEKKESYVVKTKKYSNLKDLLSELNISPKKTIINNKIKLESLNFLLDDSIYEINVI